LVWVGLKFLINSREVERVPGLRRFLFDHYLP
jgi:hypothetical protein